MKTGELRKKTKTELNKTLEDLQKNLREIRFKLATKKIKNFREIRQTKKDIAKILTLLKEKKD